MKTFTIKEAIKLFDEYRKEKNISLFAQHHVEDFLSWLEKYSLEKVKEEKKIIKKIDKAKKRIVKDYGYSHNQYSGQCECPECKQLEELSKGNKK